MCKHCQNINNNEFFHRTDSNHQSDNSPHNHSGQIDLLKVLVAAAVTITAITASVNNIIDFMLFLTAYLIAGADVIVNAIKNILKGKFLDENFLMSIASAGAFCLGDYPEAVSVMILYQIGSFLEEKAEDKSRGSISKLIKIKPEYANIEINGVLVRKKPEDISIGDVIFVKPGEKIPLDGIIQEGQSFLDTSSLTGENILKNVKKGDEVLNGSINTDGMLKILVTKLYKDSTVAKILELVENAGSRKSKAEKFITKFAKYYTPAVVILAVLIVLIPVCTGEASFNIMFERALTFLVISCPCALVISVPLTFFCAVGSASKQGILIKGSNYIEMLAFPYAVVFDKTGTLTKGVFKVNEIITADGVTKEELLELAACAENYSNHPIAQSIKEAFNYFPDNTKIKNAREIPGEGVEAEISGNIILAGNKKLMNRFNILTEENSENSVIIYIARNNKYIGSIIISDEIKETAYQTINKLNKSNIKTVMLTGDLMKNAKETADKLKIDEYYASLLPQDKVEKFEELYKNKPKQKSIIFAGDGINDAPVLMRSDAGIAMGALGSDAAVEAADIVIADDNPLKIYNAVKIAKKTMSIVKQNIIFAIGIKILFLLLGSIGLISMWGAVFADTGVTLLAVLNSLRLIR